MTVKRVQRIAAASCLALGVVGLAAAQDAPPRPTTRPAPRAGGDPATTVETIVILRHGEKAALGCGNINAQGLNRAIALSQVLPEKFGKPDYLFAPDPAQTMREANGVDNYVRPLCTIEPTACRYEMPVQTPCGYSHVDQLEAELTKPKYAAATVFVAWEHAYAREAAAGLVKQFGVDPKVVPHWHGADFDSLYIVKITRAPGQPATATFTLDHEGLDGQAKTMPVPAAK